MLIEDYLNVQELREEIANGFISARQHPTLPLTIFNYSNAAQWRGHSDITRKCRDLIIDIYGHIVARPFEKFYNYQENDAVRFDADEMVEVYDKADGSLIIATAYDGELVVSSRGSFESDQALAAYRLLLDSSFTYEYGLTTMFELVGPSNPIVLTYPEDTLLYLGDIDNNTGNFIDLANLFNRQVGGFDSVEFFGKMSYADALSLPPRPNAEGYIIRNKRGAVKMKQEDYIAAHRIIFGLSYKGLIEMSMDNTIDDYLDKVPDEMFKRVEDMLIEISVRYQQHELAAGKEYARIMPIVEQKDFALANTGAYRSECFAIRNGRDISKMIWNRVSEEYKGR